MAGPTGTDTEDREHFHKEGVRAYMQRSRARWKHPLNIFNTCIFTTGSWTSLKTVRTQNFIFCWPCIM